ncbi:MAG: hypothetical protein ABIK33_06640 [candidate division WOR-3 bacterium]
MPVKLYLINPYHDLWLAGEVVNEDNNSVTLRYPMLFMLADRRLLGKPLLFFNTSKHEVLIYKSTIFAEYELDPINTPEFIKIYKEESTRLYSSIQTATIITSLKGVPSLKA